MGVEIDVGIAQLLIEPAAHPGGENRALIRRRGEKLAACQQRHVDRQLRPANRRDHHPDQGQTPDDFAYPTRVHGCSPPGTAPPRPSSEPPTGKACAARVSLIASQTISIHRFVVQEEEFTWRLREYAGT